MDFSSSTWIEGLVTDLLVTRQITRELIIEKLLSLVDLPLVEPLQAIGERSELQYRQAALDRLGGGDVKSRPESLPKMMSPRSARREHKTTPAHNKEAVGLAEQQTELRNRRSLAVLSQTYDFSRWDT